MPAPSMGKAVQVDKNDRKKIRRDLANIIDASLKDDGYYFAMEDGIITEDEAERCYNAMLQVLMRTTEYIMEEGVWIDGDQIPEQ